MLSLPIFILNYLSLSSGTTPHHLMLQNQTLLIVCVVGDPHAGAFTRCSGLILSPGSVRLHPDWQDATFPGRICMLPQASQGTGFIAEFLGPAPGNGPH
jgi:hypothetical protein